MAPPLTAIHFLREIRQIFDWAGGSIVFGIARLSSRKVRAVFHHRRLTSTGISLYAGVAVSGAIRSSGTSGVASGKYAAAQPHGMS